MKKSTITKVLIALVMVALLVALCACGGGGNNSSSGSGSGSGSGTNKGPTTLSTLTLIPGDGGKISWSAGKEGSAIDHYEYVITDVDGNEGDVETTTDRSITIQEGETIKVRAIPKDANKYAASEWSAPETYAAGITTQIIKLVKGIQSYVDVLNSVKANDTLSADVAIGGYFTDVDENSTKSLALAAKANASANDPSFMIDFKLNETSYVSLGYKDNAILVREPINYVNNSAATAPNAFKIDVSALDPTVKAAMTSIMGMIAGMDDIQFDVVTSAVEGLLSSFQIDLEPLIDYAQEGNVVTLGVRMGLLQTALQLLPTLQGQLGIDVGEEVDKYIGYVNKGLEAVGQDKLNISWEIITQKIKAAPTDNSLVKIIATYSGKAINKLQLELDMTALAIGLNYKAGLNVDVNNFSTSKTVAIDASAFTAQDLVIDLSAALGVKGIDADAKAVIRLSDGLKTKNNKLATITVNANGKDGDKGTATGYITAEGAYVDFTGIFNMFGVEDYQTKYSITYDNIIDKINGANAANAATDDIAEMTGIDVAGFIAGLTAATDKVEYVCGFIYNNILPMIDEDVTPKATAGQADIIAWVFDIKLGDTNSKVKDYAKFYNENTTSFEILLENIKRINEGAIDTLKAAIHTEGKTAGIQFFAPNGADLLDYVAAFVKIPSIVDNNPNFEDLAEINDAAALKAWLNWIFPANKDARILVEDILGKSLDAVIDTGLYLEATGGTGLAGSVLAASDENKTELYVELGAGIGLKATANTVADISDTVAFDAQDDQENYLIANAMKALLDGLRKY